MKTYLYKKKNFKSICDLYTPLFITTTVSLRQYRMFDKIIGPSRCFCLTALVVCANSLMIHPDFVKPACSYRLIISGVDKGSRKVACLYKIKGVPDFLSRKKKLLEYVSLASIMHIQGWRRKSTVYIVEIDVYKSSKIPRWVKTTNKNLN